MPLLILHAVIACAILITPRRAIAWIQRILTNVAVARADARWIAMSASAQQEPSIHRASDRHLRRSGGH